jgi:hypothetical protein
MLVFFTSNIYYYPLNFEETERVEESGNQVDPIILRRIPGKPKGGYTDVATSMIQLLV